jgi:hypothetical protein
VTRTRADRWSTPLRALDAPANAISDVLNRAVPWLWWPLDVPSREAPLGRGAHVLYAVHGTVVYAAAGRRLLRAPSALSAGVVSWLWFSGAWDRRAARGGR